MRILRHLLPSALLAIPHTMLAQAPQAFSYQAVARDLDGDALTDVAIAVRFHLHQGTAAGPVVFAEQHGTTTNDHGLFTLQVGNGAPITGTMGGIDWSSGPYFMEVSLDDSLNGTFTSMGTQQLLSVPYALHAGSSSDLPHGTEVGQVMHWDGGAWVVDSGLYVHDRRLGIGITAPDSPLGIVADSTDGSAIRIYKSIANTTGTFNPAHWTVMAARSGNVPVGYQIKDSSSDPARVEFLIADSTGHVGIGTDDPPAPLTIESREILKTYFQTGDIPTQNDFAIRTDSTGFDIGQGSPGDLESRLFIQDSTGHVGIGTTEPSTSLHLSGADGDGSTLMKIHNTASLANLGWAFGQLHSSGPTGDGAFCLFEDLWPTAGDLDFNDAVLRVLHGGNVGIGSLHPPAMLTVGKRDQLKTYFETGDIPTQDDFSFRLTDSTGFSIEQGTPSSSVSRLFLQQGTGNVGIGTVLPSQKLSLQGAEDGAELGIKVQNTSSSANNGWVLGHLNDNAISTRDGAFSIFEQSGTLLSERITVLPNQNVGINETMPYAALHVTKPTSDPTEPISLSENTGISMVGPLEQHLVMDSRSIQARHLLAGGTSMTGSAGSLRLQPLGGDLVVHGDDATGSSRVIVTSSGNVGIAEPLPDTKLHVSRPSSDPLSNTDLLPGTGIAVLGPIDNDNLALDAKGIQARHGEYVGGGSTVSLSTTELNLQRLGGNILIHGNEASVSSKGIVTGQGELGLGTLTPLERIHIDGAIKIGTTSNSNDGTIRYTGSDFEGRKGGAWVSLTAGNGPWTIGAGNSIHYAAGSSPRVGIGTGTVDATLHVKDSDASSGSSVAAIVHNEATTSSTSPVDHRIGLKVSSSGTWGGDAQSKNIGLYVSEVSGQTGSSYNLAAVLNGNVVIGNIGSAQDVGTNGTNVLAIQNGTAPDMISSGPGSSGPVQLYVTTDATGNSILNVKTGNGEVVKLYKLTPLPSADASTVDGTYDSGEAAVINNMRDRINQLETKLQTLGLLAP